MPIANLNIVGRPFALWPATLQLMPGGVLDAGFGRFFVGVTLQNGSGAAWPATEVHLTTRGRQVLAAAGITVGDGLSLGDGAALGQSASGEWISIPALATNATQVVYFKFDVSKAAAGAHTLELEVRDPAVPATLLKAFAPLLVSRTATSGTQRAFSSTCDRGTLTATLSAVTMDQELFRRVLARARAVLHRRRRTSTIWTTTSRSSCPQHFRRAANALETRSARRHFERRARRGRRSFPLRRRDHSPAETDVAVVDDEILTGCRRPLRRVE